MYDKDQLEQLQFLELANKDFDFDKVVRFNFDEAEDELIDLYPDATLEREQRDYERRLANEARHYVG